MKFTLSLQMLGLAKIQINPSIEVKNKLGYNTNKSRSHNLTFSAPASQSKVETILSEVSDML